MVAWKWVFIVGIAKEEGEIDMENVTKEVEERMTVRVGSLTVVRTTVMHMQVGEILIQ